MTSLAVTALNQILIMFIIILVGIISYKVKLINKEANKSLSDIVLMLVNPLVIFMSYQRDFNSELLQGLLISLVLAVLTHLIGIIIGAIFIRNKESIDNLAIERFAIVYSNCGFIGIPLVNGFFGSEGVFYVTAYMTIFNIFVWTHGIMIITGKKDIKTFGKSLISPSIIATIAGFLLFIVKLRLPDILFQSLNYVGNMNTPLAMIVAGVTIAQTDIVKLLTKLKIYYIAIFKLLLIPVIMFFIFYMFHIPRIVLLTSVLAASCPTAATINLFSIRYDKNYLYSSEIFAVTTLMSVFTIPIVMMIAGYFLK